MIYTVTFNPAIDYIVRMPEFIAGATNRVNYEQVLGGGKGINVSIVLKNLGIDSTALGFIPVLLEKKSFASFIALVVKVISLNYQMAFLV